MKQRITAIFEPYFQWLENNFGNLARESSKAGVPPAEFAADFLSKDSRFDAFVNKAMPAVMAFVESFWARHHTEVESIIQQAPGLQARFGGDIGPQHNLGIVQRAGLYFDTIIVPDPLLRVTKIEEQVTKHKGFYLLKYLINQILLRDFFLSDIYPPIAILTADTELADPDCGFNTLAEISRVDTVQIVNRLFAQELQSFDESLDFISKFSTINDFESAIENPDLLYFDETVPRDPSEQIASLIGQGLKEVDHNAIPFRIDSPTYILFSLQGRMMQANDVLGRASSHFGHPLISAPVSFHWMSSKLDFNRDAVGEYLGIDSPLELSLTNSLLADELKWLSLVPSDALIKLRQRGELEDLRSLLSQHTSSISSIPLDEISRVARNVDHSLSSAFLKHQEEISQLDSQFRQDLALTIPTLLTSVLINVQPSIFPLTPALVTAAGIALGSMNVRSIIEKVAAYLRKKNEIKNQPVAILWDAKKDSET